MKKNLAVRLVFIFLALILYSCRTDESIREEERADQEKIMAFVKFHEKSTVSRFADEGSYAYPFAEIIENYFYNHPDYAGMFIKDVGTIDLQVASQTFLDGEEKIVLFPILEDKKVTAIIQCTVNADETYVSFKVLKTEVPADMQDAIRDFQEYYDNKTSETAREKSIQEVIITIYLPRNWTGSGIDYNPWGSSGSGAGGTMNGGSGIHGSGGSGNSGSQNQNPCEKTKSVINKSNIQAGINNVKAQAKLTLTNPKTGEIGFKEKKDGTVVPADVSGAHHAVFNNVTDGYGGYHNHTATGIHMVSPPDIADA
ncbi:hypothetical protein [Chryseobacterium mucoviscidosis]|uniref:Uncharacterized protein n=1 Tax=Chryseobacterium mucoviscidosis TaxID=1945581 RepID=A0A202BWZ0_9FLAO|nr:hypothetical protein [Chryseobacterium mucoviscidosis]OVE56018.1 hypothetical protein B0E34_14635 [Chryseobacterium mucoviscidosis]